MKPIFLTINQDLKLVVLPEVDGQLDGHPIITYTYNIFRQEEGVLPGAVLNADDLLKNGKQDNPLYMGYVTFESPDKLFSYTADGHDELSSDEVLELIEEISHYRKSPDKWDHHIGD